MRAQRLASPTVVVVLPSPSGVGVMAVTSMYLPCGAPGQPLQHVQVHLGFVLPEEVEVLLLEAQLLGDLDDRLIFADCAMSISDGTGRLVLMAIG